jgi:PAS domain S-box-containing protein
MITTKDKIIALLEEMIQKNEIHLHAVIKAAPIILFAVDNKGICTLLEGNGLSFLGFKSKEIVGKSIYDMYSNKPKVIEVFKRCSSGEEITKVIEISKVWMDVRLTPLFVGANKTDGIIGVAVNITKRKKIEDKFIKNQEILKISEKNLKKFSGKLLSIREEEKKKLSMNLHDELSAMVVDLNSKLDIAEEDIKNNDIGSVVKILKQTRQSLKNAVSRLKRIAVDLMPPHLDKVEISDVLKDYISNIRKQVDFKIYFRAQLSNKKIKEEVAIVLYRIVQESLNNTIKHTQAEKVRIRLCFIKKNIKLSISDDGKGFDMKILKELDGLKMGIRGMRERVEAIGGNFTIKSEPRRGTVININV